MNVAFLGAGPVSLLTASLLKKQGISVDFLLRPSRQGKAVGKLLSSEGVTIRGESSKPHLAFCLSQVQGRVYYLGETSTLPEVDTLFLATPHTAYAEALRLAEKCRYGSVVLLGSGLGSSAEVQSLVGDSKPVVTFSNFFAAAKFQKKDVELKNLKRRVFLGGPRVEGVEILLQALEDIGVACTNLSSPLEAEFRNITLYVHAVLGLAPLSLEAVFGLVPHPRYLYKLFPEGPIERPRMALYAAFVDELMSLAQTLGLGQFNFLEFLQKDNYPVADCFLSESELQAYPSFGLEKKAELLFARYVGLLVDPHSVPDKDGRYFDFSAVRIAPWNAGQALPRIPAEDIYHLLLIRELHSLLQLRCPTADRLWSSFRSLCERLSEEQSIGMNDFVERQTARSRTTASLILKARTL